MALVRGWAMFPWKSLLHWKQCGHGFQDRLAGTETLTGQNCTFRDRTPRVACQGRAKESHSDQGSKVPKMTWHFRPRKIIPRHWNQGLGQNLQAVLAAMVKLAGWFTFMNFSQDALQHIMRPSKPNHAQNPTNACPKLMGCTIFAPESAYSKWNTSPQRLEIRHRTDNDEL